MYLGGPLVASSPAADKQRSLFAPDGFANFECDRCGECCGNHARVEISPAKYERLARVLRDTGFQFPVRDALMRDEEDPSEPAVFAMVGDQCVFLTDAGRCHLCELGVPELRGSWCVSFPVTPVVTPRGVNYSISFACERSARMLRAKEPLNILALNVNGGPLPATDKAFASRHKIPTMGDEPRLDWSGYRLVKGMLLALARDWEVSTARRLVLMPLMLNYLLDGYTGPESNEALRERVSLGASSLPEMIKRAGSYRADPAEHYAALTGVFGRRIGFRTRVPLRKEIDDAVQQVQGRRTKATGGEFAAALSQLYKHHYKPGARRFEHILGNYVICRLFANREMLSGGVYKGTYAVAYLLAMVQFFATTTAAQRECRVNQKILLEAVQLVEQLRCQSRNLFDFLDGSDAQARMLDPAYAAALVRI